MRKFGFTMMMVLTAALACKPTTKENTLSSLEGSDGLRLSKLSTSVGALSPAFDPSVTDYTIAGDEVAYNKVIISAEAYDSKLSVLVNNVKLRVDFTTDPLPLQAGANVYKLELIDAAGRVLNAYNLTVNRLKDLPDEELQEIGTSDGQLEPAFSTDITSYQITVGKDTSILSITPEPKIPDDAQLEINGSLYPSDISYDEAINPGTTRTVTILVKGKSGRSKTYTITVVRPASDG